MATNPAKQTMIDTPRWGGHGPPPLPPVPAGIPDSDYNTLLLAIWVTAVVTQHNRSLIEQITLCKSQTVKLYVCDGKRTGSIKRAGTNPRNHG